MNPWAFVTPASRGIGFEITRRLLQTTNLPIVATARGNLELVKGNLLSSLTDVDASRLNVVKLDVTG